MLDLETNGGISALLLEHVPAAVALFDRDMRYLGCSHRWLTDYGLEGQDIIGRCHDQVFPETGRHMREIHCRALAGEVVCGEVEPFKHPDGSVDWVRLKMVPWRQPTGSIGGALAITQAQNDLVHIKQRVQSLNTELNLLIDSAKHHAICLLDPEGKVVIWNAGAERLYGWSTNEVVGKSYSMMFESDDRESDVPALQIKQAQRNGTFQGRSWRQRKNGNRFLADVSITRVCDGDGNLVGYGQVVRDITEESARTQQIEANEAQLRSILDTVPDAMVVIDDRGTIKSFSTAAQHVFGYDADEVIGQSVAMLMPEPDASRHHDYLAHYRSTGERRIIGNSRRLFGRRKDGTIFPLELFVGEVVAGGLTIFTGFLRDLTAHEDAKSKLHELQSELIHISRVSAIGTMATALAHELNQPLTVIANYVQSSSALLSSGHEQARELVREALEETGREALRAGAIVERLRAFIARGELDRTIATPHDLVTQACTLALVGAKGSGIRCEIAVSANLCPVVVDRVQVQQVLLNLIRNACEALGNCGTITIGALQDGGMIRFSVMDDGPGIPLGEEEELFEPFVSSKTNGMGLGLAICRTIIEAHGGRLWCGNAPDGGAAFHFTVPLAESEDEWQGPCSHRR